MELFARLGFPDEILTDRGSNFTSELMNEFRQMWGISSIKISAYHPQTDGMVERFNGTLKTGIRKMIEEFGGECLPYILFAYRETPTPRQGSAHSSSCWGESQTVPWPY